ncbi:MAG: TlpA family protein disulfide reductase [Prevotellaceae bacterium]|nr:TlpA family protein disulfide reductase [Prevotellaceae bacterium]
MDCPDDFVELALSYRHFEYVYYPLLKGDTVVVTLDSLNYPLVTSKHYPERNRVYNIPHELRQGKTHLNLEASTLLGSGGFMHIARNIDYLRTQEWGERLRQDYYPIDSLRAMFGHYQEAYMDTIYRDKQRQLLSDKVYDRYLYYLQLKQFRSKQILDRDSTYYQQIEPGISDDFLAYPSYREFLNDYIGNYLSHIPVIEAGSVQEGGGVRYSDWRQAFDELSQKPFQPRSKQIILNRCIEELAKHFSAEEIHAYLEKYVAETNDSVLFKQIAAQYNLSADVGQLLLKDMQGATTNLQQLLAKHKGKVIYIDFWGSWCHPCRAEMPAAAQLRKRFEGKEVVFVYLAYKDKEKDWQQAAREEGLSELPTSYFIQNSKNSKFLEQIGLRLVPRYIVFDKGGKLVEMNAPRPSSTLIVTILNKYLRREVAYSAADFCR